MATENFIKGQSIAIQLAKNEWYAGKLVTINDNEYTIVFNDGEALRIKDAKLICPISYTNKKFALTDNDIYKLFIKEVRSKLNITSYTGGPKLLPPPACKDLVTMDLTKYINEWLKHDFTKFLKELSSNSVTEEVYNTIPWLGLVVIPEGKDTPAKRMTIVGVGRFEKTGKRSIIAINEKTDKIQGWDLHYIDTVETINTIVSQKLQPLADKKPYDYFLQLRSKVIELVGRKKQKNRDEYED